MNKELQWIVGKKIQSIYLKRDEDYNNHIVSVSLLIDNKSIVLKVDQETDEIQLDNSILDEAYKEELKLNTLFVNKQVVSFWLPANHLGFNDVFILGLDEFMPTHFISSIASCLKISSVNHIE